MSIDVHITRIPELAVSGVPALLAGLIHRDGYAVALLYQIDACIVARVTAAGFSTSGGGTPDLEAAYEMLIFCPAWEFRWVRNGETGYATVVSEQVTTVDGLQGKRLEAYGKHPVSYLLWGGKARIENGWAVLSSPRIGAISVPVGDSGAPDNDGDAARYALEAVEYAFVDDEHGNVTVGLQRYAEIVPWRGEKADDGDARRQRESDD